MRAYVVFSGTGPILLLTTFPALTDERLVRKLAQKGIVKFIGYEVSVDRARAVYGVPFEERWTPDFGQLAKVDSPNQKGVEGRWQNDGSTRLS